jgi:DNA-binding MarR family transcriptional regulator
MQISDDLTSDLEERATVRERLLFWLLKHPLQRMEDLALALRLHASSISRHLVSLEQQGLVEGVKPSIGHTRTWTFYVLTSAGLRVVADLVGAVPAKLARIWEADEGGLQRLLPRLPALVLLQEVLSGLVTHAPLALAFPAGHAASIRWHWERDYQHAFVTKNKRGSVHVDAALALLRRPAASGALPRHEEACYYSAFMLLDGGLVGDHDLILIKDRLMTLLRFRESSERWSRYSHFPLVLVITSSSHSRDLWQWCAEEAARHLRLPPLQGAIVSLAAEGPITSSWQLSWQHLSQPGACHLQDLWKPMPRDALPPGLLAPKAVPEGTFPKTSPANTGLLVKGQFAARKEVVNAPPTVPERPLLEREAVALLSLQLSHRHREVMLPLYAHPLLATHELAVLVDRQPATLTRLLSDLHHWHCLETRETACGRRLLLSSRGLRLMAAMLHVRLPHVAEIRRHPGEPLVQRGVRHALQTLRHTAGIYRFITHLMRDARTHGHHLLWWETGARCARRYHYQGAWHNLLPDAALCYQAGEQMMRAWLEWDEGTMHQRSLAAKLSGYAHFVRARQWQRESPVLPLLLIVVPEPGQERRVQRLASHILEGTALLVRTTTASRLADKGPLEAIWWPVVPGQEEVYPERRAWLDLAQLKTQELA